ncbi:MAG: ferredoxin [Candidatus Shikimatogenerans bostrichidophilus]|nr:MAG: ferredoxin [Candidatus Shikimatogenerans bostrichidophilus]
MKKINIILHRNKCIGCGSCVLESPLFFKICKKDGKSILLNSKFKNNIYILKNINIFFLKSLIKAYNVCPVKIIKITKKTKN